MANKYLHSIWQDERADAILRDNWEARNTREIAVMISDVLGAPVTRNAVVGRAHRLGLTRLDSRGIAMAKRTQFPIQPRKHQKAPDTFMRHAPTPLPLPTFEDAPPDKRLTVEQLERDTCRYVLGDVGAPGWGFCPEKAWADSSYCRNHHIRCVQLPR